MKCSELNKAKLGHEMILKPEQKLAVLSLMEKKDVLAVLATVFKKRIILLCFYFLKFAKISTFFVIGPLASIIKDQIFEAACMLGDLFFSSGKTSLNELKGMQLVLGINGVFTSQ